jgi:hypothetical protein
MGSDKYLRVELKNLRTALLRLKHEISSIADALTSDTFIRFGSEKKAHLATRDVFVQIHRDLRTILRCVSRLCISEDILTDMRKVNTQTELPPHSLVLRKAARAHLSDHIMAHASETDACINTCIRLGYEASHTYDALAPLIHIYDYVRGTFARM